MKIYTYYEDVGFKKQLELTEVWKESWRKQGFDPVVLTKSDVENHFFYNEFCDKINDINRQATNKNINHYCLSCCIRWLAYANLKKQETFYVSDYDIINKNFTSKTTETKLHFRDSCCPCFASGNSEAFMKYIHFLLQQKQTIINWCLQEKEKTKRTNYHDQDFLLAIENQGLEENVFKMSRSPDLCKMYFPTTKEKNIKLYHLSHNNISQVIKRYKKYNKIFNVEDSHIDYSNLEEIRVILAKAILNDN